MKLIKNKKLFIFICVSAYCIKIKLLFKLVIIAVHFKSRKNLRGTCFVKLCVDVNSIIIT